MIDRPLFSLILVMSFFPRPVTAQVPPNAKAFKDVTARFQTGAEPVRVLFYSYQPLQQGIGFTIFSRSGKLLAKADIPDANAVDPSTGVYDITGEGTPNIILAAGVGAKSHEVNVYSFQDDQLKEVFNWSGWHFEVVRLNGQPVIAVTSTDYSTLPKLYKWKEGQFVEANQEFPEFFAKPIQAQEQTIGRNGFPAPVYAQACELGATALVYGKQYSQATNLCQRALRVIESSPGVIPSQTNARPEQVAAERQEAAARVQGTLNAIAAAEQRGASTLQQQ